MKVSELSGAELDYWVARAQGWTKEKYPSLDGGEDDCWCWDGAPRITVFGYCPHDNWMQCGPLIEKYKISLGYSSSFGWIAEIWQKQKIMRGFDHIEQCGESPAIAICRAVVASAYGEEVEK